MAPLGRLLLILGAVLAAAGALMLAAARIGLPGPGRLPGDLVFRGKGFWVFVPLGTSLLLSVALTLLMLLLSHGRR